MNLRLLRLPSLAVILFAALLAASVTRAGDAAFEALFARKAWDTAEADARGRLTADAADLVAASDLARVIIDANRRDKLDEAVQLLERVITSEPAVARHHFYLGLAYGSIAARAGLGGMGPAGKSRRALLRAVELEPANFDYRFALNEFYLEVPGIAGGSVAKARAVAKAHEAHDADGAALLRARIHVYEGKYADAEKAVLSVTRRDAPPLNIARRTLLTRVGLGWLDARKTADALRIFQIVTAEFPNNAAAQLGYGRARFASGDHAGALTTLQRSRELGDNAEVWYHIGLVQQTLGDVEASRVAFRGSLERRSSGKYAEDARRRLAALGG